MERAAKRAKMTGARKHEVAFDDERALPCPSPWPAADPRRSGSRGRVLLPADEGDPGRTARCRGSSSTGRPPPGRPRSVRRRLGRRNGTPEGRCRNGGSRPPTRASGWGPVPGHPIWTTLHCGRRCQAKFAGTDKTETRSILSRLFPPWLGMTRTGEAAAASSPNPLCVAPEATGPLFAWDWFSLGIRESFRTLSAVARRSTCRQEAATTRQIGRTVRRRNVGPGWCQVSIRDRHAEIRCALCACHLTNLCAKRVCPALAGCLRAFSSR